MDQLLQALAHLINDWGWLLVLAAVCGGGDVVARALSGRRANARLRGELKATKAELKGARAELQRMHELVASTTRVLTSGGDGADVAALAEQARGALDDRAHVLDLLSQVQAADRAYPQLPQELREDLDHALLRLRPSLAADRPVIHP